MHPLGAAILLTLVGTLGGLLVASTVLIFGERLRSILIPWLISYAVGTLLGAALLALLPEALDSLSPGAAFQTLLGGILTFFILEKLLLWRHCHTDACDVHSTAASLVLIGDALHNFVDGAIISAAVVTSVPLGVSTAIAVAAHEIPQEIGDFAILLGAGYGRRRALSLNFLSGLAGVAGAVLMFVAIDRLPDVLPFVLPFAAGGLLYIAMADLIPDLHRGGFDASAVRQVVLIALGVGTILVF